MIERRNVTDHPLWQQAGIYLASQCMPAVHRVVTLRVPIGACAGLCPRWWVPRPHQQWLPLASSPCGEHSQCSVLFVSKCSGGGSSGLTTVLNDATHRTTATGWSNSVSWFHTFEPSTVDTRRGIPAELYRAWKYPTCRETHIYTHAALA